MKIKKKLMFYKKGRTNAKSIYIPLEFTNLPPNPLASRGSKFKTPDAKSVLEYCSSSNLQSQIKNA